MRATRRPGCVIRSTFALFGVVFMPFAIWFAWANFHRYWTYSLGLTIASLFFLGLAFAPAVSSWLSDVFDGGPANPDVGDDD